MESSKVWRPAIEFNLTEHCNLRCEHCDHASGIMPAKFADLSSFVSDIEALSSVLHAAEFKFLGGEPLLHPEFLDFLRAAREIGIADRLVILTNGVLLHKAPAELWDLIDGMWISLYPGIRQRFDWDWIQEIADRHHIFIWRNDMPKFAERLLTEKIENEAFVRMIYENCDMAHLYSCHTIYEGRYYVCSPSVWMEPRLRLHGIGFENRQDDSVAIHDNANLHADLERLIRRREPLNACQYCLGSWARRVPNQQLTREGAREFLERNPEKLADLVNSSEWIVPRSYTGQEPPRVD